MRKIFLVLLFCVPICTSAQETIYANIGDGSKFVCIIEPGFLNFLGKVRNDSLIEIRFRKTIKKYKRRDRKLQRRIRRAERRGDTALVARLSAKQTEVQDILNDLLNCRDGQGEYFNEFFSDDPFPDNPGGGGDNGGGNPTPDNSGLACGVVGGSSGALVANFPTSRIINGNVCSVGNSPVVDIELLAGGSSQGGCSGTVVAPRVVITAAHCLEGGINAARIHTGSGVFNSASVHYHPSFDSTSRLEEFDAAVIITTQDLPTRTVKILSSNDMQVGERAVIGGYGLDENGRAGTLRAAPVVINQAPANSIQILYSGNGSNGNTCNGDSGGPILIERGGEWVLAGATSWGINAGCGAGDQSYFMNITYPSVKSFINGIVPGLIQ